MVASGRQGTHVQHPLLGSGRLTVGLVCVDLGGLEGGVHAGQHGFEVFVGVRGQGGHDVVVLFLGVQPEQGGDRLRGPRMVLPDRPTTRTPLLELCIPPVTISSPPTATTEVAQVMPGGPEWIAKREDDNNSRIRCLRKAGLARPLLRGRRVLFGAY